MRSEHGPDHSLTTMHVIQESASFYLTQSLSESTTGCRLELRYAWEPLGDPTVQVPDWLDEYVQGLFDQLSAVAGTDSVITG